MDLTFKSLFSGCLLLLAMTFPAVSQTLVSGTLPGSTTWTKAASPYRLTNNLTVNAGDTLTLEPGVVVEFNSYTYVLIVHGTLISEGLSNDSIVFTGAVSPGRVRLTSLGGGSSIRYTKFDGLGVFNNPALEISQETAVKRSTFENCEVGAYVDNGATPLIDSNMILNSNDYGIYVNEGMPTITNCTIDGKVTSSSGIYLLDTAIIMNNTIMNIGTNSHRNGIHIDADIYPYITGNTFSNNLYDILTHPAVMNDTMFDNNGLSAVHVDDKVIGHTTTWHKPQAPENWYYVLTGDVEVSTGDSLTLEPGIDIRFMHYTADLRIYGTLNSQGTPADSIYFRGNPLGGRIILAGTSMGSIVEFTYFDKLGSFNNPALGVYTSSVTISKNLFWSCEVGVTVYNDAEFVIDSCNIFNSGDWGVRVENGAPTIRNCIIDGSSTAGVYLLDTAYIYDNTLTNNGGTFNTGGVVIDAVVYPYINNNFFSNPYADVHTHPAVVNDTMFDNNGLSVIHIDNLVIGQTTTWHEPVLPEDWYYVLTGDITVNSGDTLTIEPGVDMQLSHYANDLIINGTLISEGTAQDSIIFRGVPLGGRIQISASATDAHFDYTSFKGLGAFNNPGLAIYSSNALVEHSKFNKCEVGATIYSNAIPVIDSCEFFNSSDWGIRVLSGAPLITNNLFDDNRFGAIELLDTAKILNNTFTNNGFQIPYAAIHINAVVYPYIENNTFLNNSWDMITHPAVVDDTVFDNNGLSKIHIDNVTIGQSATWHAPVPPENWHYVLKGDVTSNAGDTLRLEPGLRLEITHYTHDLLINGTLLSEGTEQDSVAFYTTNIGGRVVLNSTSAGSRIDYTSFRKLGAFNNAALQISAVDAEVHHSAFSSCEVGITAGNNTTVAVDSSLFENSTDYGLRITSGSVTIANSCIIGNSFGISADTLTTVDARFNWWGDTTGPVHVTNPPGIGDEVSNHVIFTPWLMNSPCEAPPGPMIVSLSPPDNSVNVAVGTQLKAHFNEPVQKTAMGRVKVLRVSDNSVIYNEDITHAGITVAGDSMYFSPGLLPVNTDLYVTIDSNALENTANVAFAGISNNAEWNFLTEPDDDNDGFTPSQGDCNDMDSLQFPGQRWFADTDNDGFGDVNSLLVQCAQPPGYVLDSTDCVDTDSLQFPGQTWYADMDNDGFGDKNNTLVQCLQPPGYLLDTTDCNDMDSLQFPGQTWYADTDNDGFGDANNTLVQCSQPPGYVLDSTDCNDMDSLQFPGQRWFADADNDGYGDMNNVLVQCLQPPGYVLDSTDCVDTDSLQFPGQIWYADLDQDGFGDPGNTLVQCLQPPGYLLDSLDCDDTDSTEFPGQVWYADLDGDLFGDSLNSLVQCLRPAGYVLDDTDCDDQDSTSYPGAAELNDNKDNDCDGEIDEDFPSGIDAHIVSGEINVWPNPTGGQLRIQLPDHQTQAVVEVLGLDGKRLLMQKSGKSLLTIDIGHLENGIYLLSVKADDKTYFRKIVKH